MKKILLLIAAFFCIKAVTGQELIPFNYHLQQRMNNSLYSKDTRFHTAFRNILPDDSVRFLKQDSLIKLGTDREYNSWATRKLFAEHLVEVNEEDFNFYLDFLPDFVIGRDQTHKITTWTNTRGVQIGGNIGKKFSFHSSVYENQARFPDYLTKYINKMTIIPGMGNDKYTGGGLGQYAPEGETKDWAYATALLNYTPNKYFSFTLGHDKNFIGDGYRSLLLSDVSAPYPFFKIITTLGNVKYMNLWAQFQDPLIPKLSYQNGFRKKWGVFHYLDWNVNNRLSFGFFDAIIWQGGDEAGRRGFDVTYLNPVIFLRAAEGINGSPDNSFLGLTSKYKLLNNLTVYGQFALDEFTFKEVFSGSGYWANKTAWQIGFRGFDAFRVKQLNYLFEYNAARPFTYSHFTSLTNYGNYAESLAHPMGANFREMLSIWNYHTGRWGFTGQVNFAQYGVSPPDNENVGKDINLDYGTARNRYGYQIGYGVKTNFYYLDGRVSYTLNPKYNLRLEMGAIYRREQNALQTDNTGLITFGLRSTFRNIYQDF